MRVFSNYIYDDFVMCVRMDNTNWTMYVIKLMGMFDASMRLHREGITLMISHTHTHAQREKTHPETHTEKNELMSETGCETCQVTRFWRLY